MEVTKLDARGRIMFPKAFRGGMEAGDTFIVQKVTDSVFRLERMEDKPKLLVDVIMEDEDDG